MMKPVRDPSASATTASMAFRDAMDALLSQGRNALVLSLLRMSRGGTQADLTATLSATTDVVPEEVQASLDALLRAELLEVNPWWTPREETEDFFALTERGERAWFVARRALHRSL